MDTTEAAKILGIALPIAEGALKSAFRRRSHETHPDKDSGDNEKFCLVKDAYEHLLSLRDGLVIALDGVEDVRTTCGKPLSDLGKGYPAHIHAVSCSNCSGKGYKTRSAGRTHCATCYSSGVVKHLEILCKVCCGTGRFREGVVSVLSTPCRTCRGRGGIAVILNKPLRCPDCEKIGMKELYDVCYDCRGVGEVQLFNPVLRRHTLL